MANSSARLVVDVGTVIAETYRIEALIGRGGMGSVFLASHARLPGKQVAIKLLHSDDTEGEVITRFKREAEIASRLGHPNIVGVTDFNVLSDGTPYLVLEYLQGESLGARLAAGPLPLDTVFSIVRQVGSALAAAHRQDIVHRDLKPANIFLVPTEVDGKIVEIAKVLDFGISKMRGSTTVKTQEYTLLGTPQYMAPEQAKGDHANVDQRTDIFALGSIIYEMLTGQPAFSGANIPEVCFKVVYEEPSALAQVAPNTPPDVVAAVTKAMAKAPEDRFATVGEFVEQLTGRKLAAVPSKTGISIPPPDGGPESDAFAATQNSGEFGIAVSTPRPRIPTPIPNTVEGVDLKAVTQASLPPTPEPGATVPPVVVENKRSLAPMIGIALASAAIGAAVLYFVTRGGSPPTPDAAIVAVTPDAAVIVPPEPDAALVIADAAVPDAAVIIVDAAVIVDAAIVRPRDAAPDPSSGNPFDGPRGPALQAATTAYSARDWNTAESRASEVITSDDATPLQRARGRAMRAAIKCIARFDEEHAALDIRAIPAGYRALRKQALDACHQAGYLKDFQ